ncbi:hypothetical protein ACQP2F_32705 [Actinoplanes sp. CA-030573]|uniref:hypothetical protein n=1 Tax=Actinoplanes sp. CA-030573 TaxID=3239898 RepID=UPI003D939272
MTKHPPPPHVEIDGQDGVVIPVELYESLLAGRRRLGARDARMHRLSREIHDLAALLDRIEWLVTNHLVCADPDRSECPACQIAGLVAQRPKHRDVDPARERT